MIKKYLFVMTLLLAPVSFAQQPTPTTATKASAFKAHVLSRPELDELLKHPEGLLLIDVRRPDELTSIGGFPVYLSIQISQLESSLAWIPKERKIITISNHAGRAGVAADLLTAQGFKVAGAVGVQLYAKDGGTLTKISPLPASTSTASARRGPAKQT